MKNLRLDRVNSIWYKVASSFVFKTLHETKTACKKVFLILVRTAY